MLDVSEAMEDAPKECSTLMIYYVSRTVMSGSGSWSLAHQTSYLPICRAHLPSLIAHSPSLQCLFCILQKKSGTRESRHSVGLGYTSPRRHCNQETYRPSSYMYSEFIGTRLRGG